MGLPPRRALKTDANKSLCVQAVRRAGGLWRNEGPLDGWLFNRRCWIPVELKDGSKPPSARKLTDAEADFIRDCQNYGAPYIVAVSPTDLLTQAGLI